MMGIIPDDPIYLVRMIGDDQQRLLLIPFVQGVQDLGTDKLEDTLIESLYVNNPDENQYWPIWQIFIDNSNGMLTND